MEDDLDWERSNNIVSNGLYSGFSKYLIDTSHRHLAKFGNQHSKSDARILEIGAGRGEHFRFVRSDFKNYTMTDISAWGKSVISSITEYDNRVSFELQDVQKLRFADNSFGRVICSCVLIHVDEPFKAMKELLRVTESGGVCSFYLAAEPGALLRLMRYFITAPKMKNLDVPYNLLNAFSHRNRVDGLIEIAKYVFKDSKIWFVYYPFRIRSWNLSTHVIVNVIKK